MIKVLGVTGVTSYPVQFPVISYINASSPFINADVSSLGAGYFGYVLNDSANSTVDLFLTTNGPNTLLWTGSVNNSWDTSTKNWVTVPGGVQTNFNVGDVVTFNDSSSVTNVNIVGSVDPSQTGIGVTITKSVNQYTFTGGTIRGTALVVKQWKTNLLTFDATEQGPINITAGSLTGNGNIGTTTISTNVVLNYSGTINGGLTSTGTVVFAGTEVGPISIQGGTLDNSGTMSTTSGQIVTMVAGTAITNELGATINVGTLPGNSGLPISTFRMHLHDCEFWHHQPLATEKCRSKVCSMAPEPFLIPTAAALIPLPTPLIRASSSIRSAFFLPDPLRRIQSAP